jgi:hypothetical protein
MEEKWDAFMHMLEKLKEAYRLEKNRLILGHNIKLDLKACNEICIRNSIITELLHWEY